MEHDLVAAAMGLLSDLRGAWVVWKDREGEGVVEGVNGLYRGGVRSDVVEDNGETGAGCCWARRMWRGRMTGFGGAVGVDEGVIGGFDFAAAGEG